MPDQNTRVQPRLPGGFPELLPKDQIIFNKMLGTIKEVYERFGYLPIETPAVELKEVLLAKGGGETEKQVYRLSSKSGDTDMCLHFDLTVPLARYVAQHISEITFPFRRYQMQKVWRGEAAQRGRYREFYQCDIDVIGAFSPLFDAEIPIVICSVFKKLGLDRFTIYINNRKIVSGYLEMLGLSASEDMILHAIDRFGKMNGEKISSCLQEAGTDISQARELLRFLDVSGTNEEILKTMSDWPNQSSAFSQGIQELQMVVEGMRALGVLDSSFQIDCSIVRGLDYYTGTVYETRLNDHPKIGSICSGGRYDDLCGFYTDRDLPGVGISIGLSRLFYQLKEANLLPQCDSTTAKVMVAIADRNATTRGLEITRAIRDAEVNCEVYLEEARLRKQLEYASKLGIPYVVIIGAEELNKRLVSIKDMATGEQKLVSLEMAIAILTWERNRS